MSRKDYAQRHKILGLCRNCPNLLIQGSSIYCEYHREKARASSREKSKREIFTLKNECLEAYGKKCICCGEAIKAFLTLDHEGGNGNDHRRKLFGYNVGGVHMYRWLKKNNFPSGYRILCMNCNWATRYNSSLPTQIGEVTEWSMVTVY